MDLTTNGECLRAGTRPAWRMATAEMLTAHMVSLCVPLSFLVWLPPLSLSQLAPPHTSSFLVFNLTNIGGKGRQIVHG